MYWLTRTNWDAGVATAEDGVGVADDVSTVSDSGYKSLSYSKWWKGDP